MAFFKPKKEIKTEDLCLKDFDAIWTKFCFLDETGSLNSGNERFFTVGVIKMSQPYYLQSKRPDCFAQFLDNLPENVIIVTTLETNRDEGYGRVSRAPRPSARYRQFKALEYPRKVITVEPMMDFDLEVFSQWLMTIRPGI